MTALSEAGLATKFTSRHCAAFATAAGIEVMVVVLALMWVGVQSTPKLEQVVPLTFENALQPEVPVPAAPELAHTAPKPVTPEIKPTLQSAPAPTPAPPMVAVTDTGPTPASFVPTPPKAESTPPFPVTHPTTVATSSEDPRPAYNAKLAAAVQAVFQVPSAARELSFKGRARVEFILSDGVVSAIQLIQSSGFSLVDRAAMRAVQVAAYPPAPASLQGKEGRYQIWVECY